ncbi:unnamed protein product [Cochlearia groenlandica]
MRAKTKFRWIANEKARKAAYSKRMQGLIQKVEELTILCNVSACLIFHSRDDNKLVAWPSKEAAKSLLDRFFDLPFLERSLKADDQESYIKTNIKKVEKKLADTRQVIDEIEINNLMFAIQNGTRDLNDLSEAEIEKLIAFSKKKIDVLGRHLGYPEHVYHRNVVNETSSLRREIPRISSDVFSQLRGNGSYYLMDQWFFFDEPKDQNHGDDDDHVPTMGSRFNLNVEPYDDDDDDDDDDEEDVAKAGGAGGA